MQCLFEHYHNLLIADLLLINGGVINNVIRIVLLTYHFSRFMDMSNNLNQLTYESSKDI